MIERWILNDKVVELCELYLSKFYLLPGNSLDAFGVLLKLEFHLGNMCIMISKVKIQLWLENNTKST